MASHLTTFLLQSHGAAWPGPGAPVAVRADHVLLDDADGTVALLALEAMGAPRVACELALVAPPHEATGPDDGADLRYLQGAAAAYGLRFARPGAGPAAAIHRRRFAAPGRVLAAAVPGAGGCGAFGMLALPAGPLECAAAMAGQSLVRPRPRVIGVHVTGAPPAGAGGADLVRRLRERLGGGAAGAALEFRGDGLGALPMADRIAVAAAAPAALGALAAVFPSDDRTRAYLRARGRDSDWRRLEGGGAGFDEELALDLAALEPGGAEPRGAGDVEARLAGLAEDADVRRLARALAGARVRPDARLALVPGGRAAHAALAAELAVLAAAGVELLEAASPAAAIPPGPEAWRCGDPAAPPARAASAWRCAALALGLSPAEARARAGDDPDEAAGAGLDPAELLEPAGGAPERGPRLRVPAAPPAFEGCCRGVVLLDAGDDAGAATILPWGPRAHAARGDADELAGALFRPLDPGAAARARALGGVFVCAGERYGGGEPAEAAARATAALGVRAVIAGSYAGDAQRLLALHGVLPLLWPEGADRGVLRPGDELEIAGLPEALAPGAGLALRHLTRGLTLGVRHALDAPTLAAAQAGGLLRSAVGREGA